MLASSRSTKHSNDEQGQNLEEAVSPVFRNLYLDHRRKPAESVRIGRSSRLKMSLPYREACVEVPKYPPQSTSFQVQAGRYQK